MPCICVSDAVRKISRMPCHVSRMPLVYVPDAVLRCPGCRARPALFNVRGCSFDADDVVVDAIAGQEADLHELVECRPQLRLEARFLEIAAADIPAQGIKFYGKRLAVGAVERVQCLGKGLAAKLLPLLPIERGPLTLAK